MNGTATWLGHDNCPACGTGLHLTDDGTAVITWHCPACGFTLTSDLVGKSGVRQ
jgi:ribosomal protein S27AE